MPWYALERKPKPPTMQEFAKLHGLTMQVTEQTIGKRYTASFKRCDLKGDGVLIGAYGDSFSPESAIEQYAKRIAGGVLVLHAGSPDRREIYCPSTFTEGV